jgi:anti-anti-sigma factor
MADVSFLDSTAVGTLVALTREAKKKNGELVLAAVPENIQRTLAALRLSSFFMILPTVELALSHFRQENLPEVEPVQTKIQSAAWQSIGKVETNSAWTVIKVPRRLDAAAADSFIAQCEASLSRQPFLILDFAATVFLASAGLAALAKIQRSAQEQNGQMRVANCSEDVSRVIEMVRFDKILSVYKDVASAMAHMEPASKV